MALRCLGRFVWGDPLMPLKPGASDEVVSDNIRELTGKRPMKQSIAIALAEKRKYGAVAMPKAPKPRKKYGITE